MTATATRSGSMAPRLPSEESIAPSVKARHPRRRLLEFKRTLPLSGEVALGAAAWLLFLAAWTLVVRLGWANAALVPTPWAVVAALRDLLVDEGFARDVGVSVCRIVVSFALACAFAVPLGVLMGAFRVVEAAANPLVAPARYLPAPAFIPLLLMWLGTGDGQKLALLFLGVVWFLVTLVMDEVKRARAEYIEASRTLGADRRRVLLRVLVPEAMPGIVTAMRQMLAVSWTYLVIAEIVAATDGVGAMMMRAKRFIRTDDIAAGILTIGVLGIAFDLLFRLAHRVMFRYLYVERA